MSGLNGGVTDTHVSDEVGCDGEMVHDRNEGRYEVWVCNCEGHCSRDDDYMLRDKYQDW